MKRKVEKYDFKALGQAIKEARNVKGMSRNQLADKMNIAPGILHLLRTVDSTQAYKFFMNLLPFWMCL